MQLPGLLIQPIPMSKGQEARCRAWPRPVRDPCNTALYGKFRALSLPYKEGIEV